MCGTMLRQSMVNRTKKANICFGCARLIPKGTMAQYTVGVDGRDISADYMCLDCVEFSRTEIGRGSADDDGCLNLWCFREAKAPYISYPILEPA